MTFTVGHSIWSLRTLNTAVRRVGCIAETTVKNTPDAPLGDVAARGAACQGGSGLTAVCQGDA